MLRIVIQIQRKTLQQRAEKKTCSLTLQNKATYCNSHNATKLTWRSLYKQALFLTPVLPMALTHFWAIVTESLTESFHCVTKCITTKDMTYNNRQENLDLTVDKACVSIGCVPQRFWLHPRSSSPLFGDLAACVFLTENGLQPHQATRNRSSQVGTA